MSTAKYKRNQRVTFKPENKRATIVAADTTRALVTTFYIIRVDGEGRDRFNITESDLK